MFSAISRCRICGNTELEEVLDLGNQALTGVFPSTRSQQITIGPLKLVKCVAGRQHCGLLQLQHSYDLKEMYGFNYGYRSGLNPTMVRHLQNKVADILGIAKPEHGALIVDIGSNDGTTLRAYPPGHFDLVGMDPTGEKFRSYYPPGIRLIADFFSAKKIRETFGGKGAAIVTSIAMFYDLEDPAGFMREIEQILSDEGVWLSEQSYMPSMLETSSYDTVCHEHLEYYTLGQIVWMAQKVGLKVIDVELNDVNGGSFSTVVVRERSARQASPRVAEVLNREKALRLDTGGPYEAFAGRVRKHREELLNFIDGAHANGKTVAGLGASTKGNVLLQYCKVTESQISKIGEVNPDKFGCFTPGTLLPIVPEDELLRENPDYLVVLPWHFRKFFETKEKYKGRRLVFPLPRVEIVTT
jgi:C-methyltransferase C-terminal domain/Putative zinc binding domain/Methyltransferase domain